MGSEDAPATAKREDEKNVFSAASICFWLVRKKMEFYILEICYVNFWDARNREVE